MFVKIKALFFIGFAILNFLPNFSTAQSQFTISVGPSIISLDYGYSFSKDRRHGGEVGFIISDPVYDGDFAFDELTVYQLEGIYSYSLVKKTNFNFDLGLGYRSSDANSEGSYEYGFISLPLTLEYHSQSGLDLRLRATNLFGDGDDYLFVPTIGLSFRF